MRLLHLIYIHGFQGTDTTFQSFPTDLQHYLSANIPTHLGLEVQSSLYPTYKSVKPLSFATKNFLEWLSTQPEGPVILVGHSMGGLLAAEAATHASNSSGVKPSRIVGVIAFDTPYLGMHPHVVITGIASLFRDDEGKEKTDKELNDTQQVTVVDDNVTDDWDAFKAKLSPASRPVSVYSASSSQLNLSSSSSSSSSPSRFSFIDRTVSFLSSHSDDPFVRWARKHSDAPFSASKRWIVERFQFGSCMFDPSGLTERYTRLVNWQGGLWVNYWTQTVPKRKGGSPNPGINEVQSQESASATNREITLESSPSLAPSSPSPSPPGYAERADDIDYLPALDTTKRPPLPPRSSASSLVSTPPPLPPRSSPVLDHDAAAETALESLPSLATSLSSSSPPAYFEIAGNDTDHLPVRDPPKPPPLPPRNSASSLSSATTPPPLPPRSPHIQSAPTSEGDTNEARQRAELSLGTDIKPEPKTEKDKSKSKSARHFIVLPTGLGQVLGGGENWDKVLISGVEDEVAAHCGLFKRHENLEYDAFVERVGRKVLGWCEKI